MASTTAQDVTQGLERNSRSLEHHSEMRWGSRMKFTNVSRRQCARPSESLLCTPAPCPRVPDAHGNPTQVCRARRPRHEVEPCPHLQNSGGGWWVGWGWSEPHGSDCTFRIISLELRKNANQLQQPSNIFQDINHIYYTSEKKHKLCPYVLNISQFTHTVWMECIKISPTSTMNAQPRQGSRDSGLTVLKF